MKTKKIRVKQNERTMVILQYSVKVYKHYIFIETHHQEKPVKRHRKTAGFYKN